MILSEEDIKRLKAAYRDKKFAVTLTDGREIVHRQQHRFNSCSGCIFAHTIGCYCDDGEIWIDKKTFEDEQD